MATVMRPPNGEDRFNAHRCAELESALVVNGRSSPRAPIRPARPRGTGEQSPPAMRPCDSSAAHPRSWTLPSAGSVEEPQFEFHRLVIQDGQAVVITSVAVE